MNNVFKIVGFLIKLKRIGVKNIIHWLCLLYYLTELYFLESE